jgi:hypothetical protein
VNAPQAQPMLEIDNWGRIVMNSIAIGHAPKTAGDATHRPRHRPHSLRIWDAAAAAMVMSTALRHSMLAAIERANEAVTCACFRVSI